jgi:hypothetical protein
VEFSKLQNLDTVRSAADETPLELSILSTKVGNVRYSSPSCSLTP